MLHRNVSQFCFCVSFSNRLQLLDSTFGTSAYLNVVVVVTSKPALELSRSPRDVLVPWWSGDRRETERGWYSGNGGIRHEIQQM